MSRERIPLEKRFWNKVDVRGEDECWEWQASRKQHGYGQISNDYDADRGIEILIATHVSWNIAHDKNPDAKIPKGMQICHSCDNPPCVNPKHLFLGTAQDNADDKAAKGRGYWQKDPEGTKRILDHARTRRKPEGYVRMGKKLAGWVIKQTLSGNPPHAKLTETDVLAIRKEYETVKSLSQIAKKYQIDQSAVSLIVNRKRWKHI